MRLSTSPTRMARRRATRWWEELTERGGEGMVVKPLTFIATGRRGLVQPALKCRGREYLRIIYGPEYTLLENLEQLRERGLSAKRSLALREFALGVESLERFVRKDFSASPRVRLRGAGAPERAGGSEVVARDIPRHTDPLAGIPRLAGDRVSAMTRTARRLGSRVRTDSGNGQQLALLSVATFDEDRLIHTPVKRGAQQSNACRRPHRNVVVGSPKRHREASRVRGFCSRCSESVPQ
jgi:hypothetical protein